MSISTFLKQSEYNSPETQVVCYLHWNFDHEKYPFPAHRKLAKKLIDIGADVIIGNHSHVPQGGELHKGKPIIYGLGNFYIPNGEFFNGALRYPEESMINCAFEIRKDEYVCHWLRFDPQQNSLKIIKSENFPKGLYNISYTPYAGMNNKKYDTFFKDNRKKKKLTPIFFDYKSSVGNLLKELFMFIKIHFIRLLKRRG